MSRWKAFVFLALVVWSHPCASAQELGEVRLAFWNLQWFPGGSPAASEQAKLAQTKEVQPSLERLQADVIGLLEVRDLASANLALERSKELKVDVCSAFVDPETGEPAPQQIAIASKIPAMSGWWEPWKATGVKDIRRGFSFTAYEPRPGNILLVYALHLKSNRGELHENMLNREETVRQLIDHQRTMEKAYEGLGSVSVVVGGDFNTSADDPRFRHETTLRKMLAAGFQWSWKGLPFSARVTIPSRKTSPYPDACFDHVFVRGAELTAAWAVVTPPRASDHRPVMVSIRLPVPKKVQTPLTEASPEPTSTVESPP